MNKLLLNYNIERNRFAVLAINHSTNFLFCRMETKYVILFHILLILLSQTSSQKLSTFGRAKPQAPTDETADSQPKLKTFGSIGSTSTQSTNFYTRNRRRWWFLMIGDLSFQNFCPLCFKSL